MEQHVIDGQVLDAGALVALAASGGRFAYGPAALQRLEADRAVVLAHLDAGAPVDGLNSALGGLITEAGGGFSQWDGTPGVGDSVVATNGLVHAQAIALLNGA